MQDTGGNGGTVITHDGGMAGHAALTYSTPDGSKTLTAALNHVDDAALSMAEAFQKATQRLVKEVFGGGQAGPIRQSHWTPHDQSRFGRLRNRASRAAAGSRGRIART